VNLADDPRWRRFNDASRVCSCCGDSHSGVYDIAYDHPDPWSHGHRGASGQDHLQIGGDWLTSDLCCLDGHYSIRCTLPIPVIGSGQTFSFGIWVSCSEETIKAYASAWKSDDYSTFHPWSGCLINDLPTFDAEDWILGEADAGDGSLRPTFHVSPETHHIGLLQKTGITFDRLLDIYAAAGDDLRPHLAKD
jgi:hypothetical protein